MKLYISASDYYKALGLKTLIEAQSGHRVIASWINDPQLTPNRKLKPDEKDRKGALNLADIDAADALILMDDYGMVPGGKFFEVGYAFKADKVIYVLGRIENLYLYSTEIVQVESVAVLLNHLEGLT